MMMRFSAGSNLLIDAMIETAQENALTDEDILRGLSGALYSAMVAADSDNMVICDSNTGEALISVCRYK